MLAVANALMGVPDEAATYVAEAAGAYTTSWRPHSALDGRPPISRVRNVPGQDT